MTDRISPELRSQIMAKIRGKNTHPELVVRSLVHRLGFRFRLHKQELPGKPDLVFPRHRKILFVHGCFWHGHGCRRGKMPQSRLDYWKPKIERNRTRDESNLLQLTNMGWRTLTLWECEIQDLSLIERKIKRYFLGSNGKPRRIMRKRVTKYQG